jgi:MYXO-CTERM domain-containing protein
MGQFVRRQMRFWGMVRLVGVALGGLAIALAVLVPEPAAGPFTSNGTQPIISKSMETSTSCQNCHGDYDSVNHIEPWPTWVGSMMGQAGRDPLFWASVDVAEHDFPGIGELCQRCHAPDAWLDGRFVPAGSGDGCTMVGNLDDFDNDFDGLSCHFCHRMKINPTPPVGQLSVYEENGQFWIDDGDCGGNKPCRRGPYLYPQDGAEPPHRWDFSAYHEDSQFCGNCHNVTNPALTLIIAGVDTGTPMPVERTYMEYQQSDYADLSSPSFKTCQNCHMPDPTASPIYACKTSTNDRTGDLPVHDFAGGNAWIPDVLRGEYPNLGIDAELAATRDKALDMLQNQSATVVVTAPVSASAGTSFNVTVRVTNHTGHKLPTGYPEGRRMWLHVQATDGNSTVFFESAAYDTASGILSEDTQAKIYETKPGRWNHNGTNECDVVDGAASPMFHFVLNNCIHKDNRIPPLGFTGGLHEETQPVGYSYPETAPGSGILVNYDETDFAIPVPAATPGPITVLATLRYQTTSKEYVEFLDDQATTYAFAVDCNERTTGFPTVTRGAYMKSLWDSYGRSGPVDMDSDSGSVTVNAPAVCGDGNVDPGETCDPPSTCPTTCDDGNSCTEDLLSGSAATCNAACSYPTITACTAGDGCCPAGCDNLSDADCSASCGNSVVEAGETCDPPSTCPTTCDDGNSCTTNLLTGSAATCNVACSYAPIAACINADGCCPVGCDASVDDDCSASCGNSVVEPGETCDPPASCPTDCDDSNACTLDTFTGSAANCNVACSYAPISACSDADGCCPAGCDAAVDDDCSASCGNNVLEPGETCDPPASCATDCDDGNGCTLDTLTGSAANCNVACSYAPISACSNGDGCCPVGCDAGVDDDCSASCGNNIVEPGETCDPPASCPTDCDDSNDCTLDTFTGSAANCNAACSSAPISGCADGDGCCPAGCDDTVDADCSSTCGDGVVDAGETCDPPTSCPSDCDDSDACTTDELTGSAANCNVDCSNTPISECSDGDGCCAPGCDETVDSDCSTDTCGNGILDPGETCDPPSDCPTSCDDSDSCTTDTLAGSADTCDATCTSAPITLCTDDDGCCPDACDVSTDNDCTDASAKKSGCGCQTTNPTQTPLAPIPTLFGLLGLLGLWIRRRRQ